MFRCDDCTHSFYVPGTNLPLVIQGGCPECGGHARPEPDQPSGSQSDGTLRDMVDPSTGDDAGGNPLQEGILGQTDGGWDPGRKRDESFASVKQGAHGLIPCPNCGGDIQFTRSWDGQEVYQCSGCRRQWPDNDQALKEIMPKGIDCPQCGSEMHFRDAAGLTSLHPEGAWECSNRRCWHMMHPGEQVPDTYTDPDSGHSDLTLPEDWGKASSQGAPRKEWMTPMRNHPHASNQTPALPWQFDVEEVAEPGMDNDEAEAKINGQEKKAFLPALAVGTEALLGGGALAGGEAAGGAGASGGLGALLQKAAPSLLGHALGQGMFGGGGGAAAAPAQAAPLGGADERPLEMVASGGIPTEFPKDTEDPEKVDPKEHNDGDHQNFQNDISVNDMGGTASPGASTPGLEALEMLLPLVVHYAESPESGMDHPLIAALHGLLGQEGHLDGPEDPQAVLQVIEHVKGGKPADDSSSLPTDDNADGAHDEPRTDAPAHPDHKQASGHQGPTNPEQIAAVQQLLMDQGRADEVPNVPMQPWQYANELAQLAQHEGPPKDMSQTQPQPVQEEAPPEDTMPMPGMTAPPPGQFGTPTSGVYATSTNSSNFTARWAHDHVDPLQGVPAADQVGQEDPSQEQDTSGQWQTDDGQPLVVGEQYELHTPGVDIPDVVRVHAVRPESVTLEFTGAYDMGFTKDVTRQEFAEMGYTLSHVRGDEPEAQASDDANNNPEPEMQPTFGTPSGGDDHNVMSSTKWHVSFMPGAPGGTQPGGQCAQCGGPLQPNGACAGCERGAMAPGAPGVPAAPGGIQSPAGGPPQQMAAPMNPGGSNPSRPPQSRTPSAYSSVPSQDPDTGELLDADAQRLIARLLANAANDTGDEDQDGTSILDRTAGAHYTPREQRELIDEDGVARNADKLDLSHTHYEARRHTTGDDFLFGL
jgi:DNA-directed RNA polymerase subunit RPC12/RpoP